MDERWLVTGALGCIGSWVVRLLVDEGHEVTTFDLATEGPRLDLVVGSERLARVARRAGDLRDLDAVRSVVHDSAATHIVHLAALQVPFCRADPTLGAQVNVVGTVNVFQAALDAIDHVKGLAYASSIAAYDALDVSAADGELHGHASTLYGVYKRANEGTAHVYWQDHSLPSIGLRPHTVYGPGRDQGLTSEPTQAMAAAAAGLPYDISFGGRLSMQFTADVAADFVGAARAVESGAEVVNLPGTVAGVEDVIAAISAAVPDSEGTITCTDRALPFPEDVANTRSPVAFAPRTTLVDGVARTIEHLRAHSAASRA